MTVLHTVLHATAFVWNDPRRDVRKLWPTDTEIGTHDILVAGRSLTDLASERHTPCVLIAPVGASAVHPEADAHVTLVVARITAREERHGWHHATATVDCDLRPIIPLVTHIELLNSPRARDLVPTILRSSEGDARLRARLPKTSSPGDLVVFACTGTLALSQVALRAHVAEPRDDDEDACGPCRKYLDGPVAE
jgi:hypothetical protein